jgi:hypothetical protein
MQLDKRIKNAISFLTSKNTLWIIIAGLIFIFIYNLLSYFRIIEGVDNPSIKLNSSNLISKVVIKDGVDGQTHLQIAKLEFKDINNTTIKYSVKGGQSNNEVSNATGHYVYKTSKRRYDYFLSRLYENKDTNPKKFPFISNGKNDILTITFYPPVNISKIILTNRKDDPAALTAITKYSIFLYDKSDNLLADSKKLDDESLFKDTFTVSYDIKYPIPTTTPVPTTTTPVPTTTTPVPTTTTPVPTTTTPVPTTTTPVPTTTTPVPTTTTPVPTTTTPVPTTTTPVPTTTTPVPTTKTPVPTTTTPVPTTTTPVPTTTTPVPTTTTPVPTTTTPVPTTTTPQPQETYGYSVGDNLSPEESTTYSPITTIESLSSPAYIK